MCRQHRSILMRNLLPSSGHARPCSRSSQGVHQKCKLAIEKFPQKKKDRPTDVASCAQAQAPTVARLADLIIGRISDFLNPTSREITSWQSHD